MVAHYTSVSGFWVGFFPSRAFFLAFSMHRHFPLLRKFLLVVLIPLILINGRDSAGCICLDGHVKLFCDGNGCCAGNSHGQNSDQKECGDCCNHSHSSIAEAVHSCCDHSKIDGVDSEDGEHRTTCRSPNGCQRLTLLPVKLTEKDSVKAASDLAVLDTAFYTGEFLSVAVSHLPIILPPIERQKLLQRFLI